MISRIMIIVYQVNGQTINILSLANISRSDLATLLECRAQNNNLSRPAVTGLKLLVACKSVIQSVSQSVCQSVSYIVKVKVKLSNKVSLLRPR